MEETLNRKMSKKQQINGLLSTLNGEAQAKLDIEKAAQQEFEKEQARIEAEAKKAAQAAEAARVKAIAEAKAEE